MTTATGFPFAARTHEIVFPESPLIPFELLPRDVAGMVILYQHAPFFNGFRWPTVFLARPPTTAVRGSVLPQAYAPANAGLVRIARMVWYTGTLQTMFELDLPL